MPKHSLSALKPYVSGDNNDEEIQKIKGLWILAKACTAQKAGIALIENTQTWITHV